MSDIVRRAILDAADAIEAAREPLCELDASTGDGDHGVTMAIGARGVRRQLEAVDGDAPEPLVRAAARGMAGAGGAIGPIYGRGLLAVADVLQADDGRDEAPDRLLGALARCVAAAESAITELGHAAPGDKTILDALIPTGLALRQAADDAMPLADGLQTACAAARAGADSTVEMAATIGRAARFGEGSRGTADPGATSFAIIVDALVTSALASVGSHVADQVDP